MFDPAKIMKNRQTTKRFNGSLTFLNFLLLIDGLRVC